MGMAPLRGLIAPSMRTDSVGNQDNLLWEEPVRSRFSAVAKTFLSPLAIIPQGGQGRLARVHDGEHPPLDLNKGRFASDHGAGGRPSPQARKNLPN